MVVSLSPNGKYLIMSAKRSDKDLSDEEHVAPGVTNSLCCPVTWNIGNYSPDNFYQQFLVEPPNDYAEFSFEEMKAIYHYKGMDYWPLLMDALAIDENVKLSDTSCLISLVSVNAINSLFPRQWGRSKGDKAGMALNKI